MLRRFEMYAIAPGTGVGHVDDLTRALQECGTFVPEVLDSAVGRNRSPVPVDLVWEHAYADEGAYARYMCHPYHVCVLDRFLLPESPECITAPRRDLALGLVGYEIDSPRFRADGGMRRVVAMRAAPRAPDDAIDVFLARLDNRASTNRDVLASVAAANSMGRVWFPDGWTHVWEQTFADEAAMHRAADEEEAWLAAGPMSEWLAVWYEPEAGGDTTPGSEPDHDLARPDVAERRLLHVVDEVEVAAEHVAAYLGAFEQCYLPGARARGLELVTCGATPAGIGEPVVVVTVLAAGDWAAWERARNDAVRDPAVAEWVEVRRDLMVRGRRRFVVGAEAGAVRRGGR